MGSSSVHFERHLAVPILFHVAADQTEKMQMQARPTLRAQVGALNGAHNLSHSVRIATSHAPAIARLHTRRCCARKISCIATRGFLPRTAKSTRLMGDADSTKQQAEAVPAPASA